MTIEIVYGAVNPHPELADDWRILDKTEQQRASRIGNPLARTRYIKLRALTRRLLAKRLNCRPDDLTIAHGAHGKPFLPDHKFHFNLSHSHDQFALALSDAGEVGVDLERFNPPRPLHVARLARRCFANDELAFWQNQPTARQWQVFFQFWTLKEALVKASGLGIQAGLRNARFDFQSPGHPLAVPEHMGRPEDWCWRQHNIGQASLVSVVYRAPERQVSWREYADLTGDHK